MADSNEELKKQIEKLGEEIETLKKQLKENKDNDQKHYEETKELQKRQHADDLKWKKIGTFSTPITLIIAVITWWLNKQNENKKADNETNAKLDKVLKALKENKE